MTIKQQGDLRRWAHVAYEAAIVADDAWQAELDKLKVERYSKAASGAEGTELRALYEVKLAADEKRREAANALRCAEG